MSRKRKQNMPGVTTSQEKKLKVSAMEKTAQELLNDNPPLIPPPLPVSKKTKPKKNKLETGTPPRALVKELPGVEWDEFLVLVKISNINCLKKSQTDGKDGLTLIRAFWHYYDDWEKGNKTPAMLKSITPARVSSLFSNRPIEGAAREHLREDASSVLDKYKAYFIQNGWLEEDFDSTKWGVSKPYTLHVSRGAALAEAESLRKKRLSQPGEFTVNEETSIESKGRVLKPPQLLKNQLPGVTWDDFTILTRLSCYSNLGGLRKDGSREVTFAASFDKREWDGDDISKLLNSITPARVNSLFSSTDPTLRLGFRNKADETLTKYKQYFIQKGWQEEDFVSSKWGVPEPFSPTTSREDALASAQKLIRTRNAKHAATGSTIEEKESLSLSPLSSAELPITQSVASLKKAVDSLTTRIGLLNNTITSGLQVKEQLLKKQQLAQPLSSQTAGTIDSLNNTIKSDLQTHNELLAQLISIQNILRQGARAQPQQRIKPRVAHTGPQQLPLNASLSSVRFLAAYKPEQSAFRRIQSNTQKNLEQERSEGLEQENGEDLEQGRNKDLEQKMDVVQALLQLNPESQQQSSASSQSSSISSSFTAPRLTLFTPPPNTPQRNTLTSTSAQTPGVVPTEFVISQK